MRPEDIEDDTTVGEIISILDFRTKIGMACELIGADPHSLSARSQMNRLPTWTVEQGLLRHGQRRPNNTGSDLNDRFLACLALYADLTYLDKRTHQDALQARRSSADFNRLVGRVEKVCDIGSIVKQLPSFRRRLAASKAGSPP